MEPRIQYAKTSDGVSIAYSTLGEGEPLVGMPNFAFAHAQVERQDPRIRGMYDRLTEKRKLIRYDHRGGGLSDRDVTDFSLDAQILDLEAVVDRPGLERFALWGVANSGPAAIAYAAQHAERVSQLILWCAWARASDWSHSPQFRALRGLLNRDWETYTETYAHIALGWSAGAEAHRVAALMRESVTQGAMQAWAEAVSRFDVTHLLSQVNAPTLVLHPRQDAILPVEVARSLASRIPDARLVLVEGQSPRLLGDMEAVLTAIDEFLGEGEQAAPAAVPPQEVGAFRTVLFTDVEGSTAMTQRLGDAKAREVLREHERITREVLKAHGGAEVKTMGDGFMASFVSVTKAVECAIALQREIGDRQSEIGEPIAVRCGLNAGEPIEEEGDLFGATVILAARIAAKAEGGEILVADTVRGLCSGKGFLFSDRGEFVAKGFEEPVRVYEVRWTPFDSPADADGSG